MVDTCTETPLATHADTLSGHSVAGLIELAEVPFTTQINVRVDPKSPAAERIGTALGVMLPQQPGEIARTGHLTVLWLGPDEWLVLGAPDTAETIRSTLATAIEPDDHATVVDVSAHRTTISVSGPKTRELLNKGCSMDLHPSAFASDRCAQTVLARAGVILTCWDASLPKYWLLVRSSFARYLAEWLVDAVAEYRVSGGGT